MAVMNQPVPSWSPYGHPEAVGTSNLNGILFTSVSRNQTDDPHGLGAGIYVTDAIPNPRARGVKLFVNTETSGAGTVAVKIQERDPVTGGWHDLPGATTGALNDPADVVLTVYPGIAETANVSVSDFLGSTWRVHATVATAAVTFSVGADYLG